MKIRSKLLQRMCDVVDQQRLKMCMVSLLKNGRCLQKMLRVPVRQSVFAGKGSSVCCSIALPTITISRANWFNHRENERSSTILHPFISCLKNEEVGCS
mmetsp:Transcript_4525/g.6936  ORF Transcript_4525/g.6936 Transcript_4525/m.6936 type:complete len:99 (-) Transcript_4525:312-608(-)